MPKPIAPATEVVPADWSARRGPGPGLSGLSGKVRLKVADKEIGVLNVARGEAEIGPPGPADAIVSADTLETLVGLLGGEIQAFVARLQNRVQVEGDAGLVVRIFFGLRAGSPWTGLAPGRSPHA
ncbi:SCP2 sterol-binding domain-containing protein [Phenylobacterium sp. LjRoot164]|uniref:hypothetical protein n=1 Tax=unclassified Phenylobacterium TaxID=2640670 RepID=UPI003ED16742